MLRYICQIAETCRIHTPISRNVNAWQQNYTFTSWGQSHNMKKMKWLLFLVQCNKIYFMYNVCIFWDFSCPNSTEVAKITWPVSIATSFKSHKSETGFWLFCTKIHILCKFHQNRRLSISTHFRSLQRTCLKAQQIGFSNYYTCVFLIRRPLCGYQNDPVTLTLTFEIL